jgi:hypothetical protein
MRFFLLLMALTAGLITGRPAEGYSLIGLGVSSCGAWTAARRNQRAFGYEQWVLGFLSGTGFAQGQFGNDPLNNTDADGVWGWLDIYCLGHPLDNLGVAGAAFFYAHPR